MLERLAVVAAGYQALATDLTRHAAMCDYPTLRAGLEALAATRAEQAATIHQMLLDRGLRPQARSSSPADGASNWVRLSTDLALQTGLFRDLNQAIVELEGDDYAFAARLRGFAAVENSDIGTLRDLALKCDPQALD